MESKINGGGNFAHPPPTLQKSGSDVKSTNESGGENLLTHIITFPYNNPGGSTASINLQKGEPLC
jgi:hypothetical protein